MADQDMTSATFRASLPPIMSAIKAGGDGMRVQFDIPESEMGEAVKLLQWRDKVLIITVKPDDDGNAGKGRKVQF